MGGWGVDGVTGGSGVGGVAGINRKVTHSDLRKMERVDDKTQYSTTHSGMKQNTQTCD